MHHPSDFHLARQHNLIPADTSYSQCRKFFARFKHVLDQEVSPRYRYGELRLKRVNILGKVFLRRFHFHKAHTHYEYATYFARFGAPLLFAFAFSTVVLSAMQVELATLLADDISSRWSVFRDCARWFSVLNILASVSLLVILLSLFLFMGLRELVFAIRVLLRNNRQRKNADTKA